MHHTPSHTSPLAQIKRDLGTSSDGIKIKEGHGRRQRHYPGCGFSSSHLQHCPTAQGKWVGSGGGTFPAGLCRAAFLGLEIPAQGTL